jgi:hypothetical protein
MPGKRISKLPRFLRFPALIWRNIYFLPHNLTNHLRRQDSQNAEEIRKSLTLSVHYIYGAAVCGDVGEFGTMTGRSAAYLAKALSQYDDLRRLLLFDSFEGLPEAQSPVDRSSLHVRAGIWSAGTCRGVTREELLRLCRRYLPDSRIMIYGGWFSETLRVVSDDTRFAMLHIDSDLYQSARDVLEHCFAHRMVSRGAAIHFDDWDCNRADPNCGERRAWSETVEKFSILYSDCGQYGWGARKFIIHSYCGMDADDAA